MPPYCRSEKHFGPGHYASSLGLICACGRTSRSSAGVVAEAEADLFSSAFCLLLFVLILFSSSAQKCNRRNIAWKIWTSTKGSLINWLSWARRAQRSQSRIMSGTALSPGNELKFGKLSNDTFTYMKKKTQKACRLPHVTKIYKILTLIACGVVFWLGQKKKRKPKK